MSQGTQPDQAKPNGNHPAEVPLQELVSKPKDDTSEDLFAGNDRSRASRREKSFDDSHLERKELTRKASAGTRRNTLRRLQERRALTRPERFQDPEPMIDPKKRPTCDLWVLFTRLVTFWAPDYLLASLGGMVEAPVQQAWREKVALCAIIATVGGAVAFFTVALPAVLCPPTSAKGMSIKVNSVSGTAGIHGNMFNTFRAPASDEIDFSAFPGSDLSNLFERPAIAACQTPMAGCLACTFDLCRPNGTSTTMGCPLGSIETAGERYGIRKISKLVGYDWEDVTGPDANFGHLVINGRVLDFSRYVLMNPKPVRGDPVDKAIRIALEGPRDATATFYRRGSVKRNLPCLLEKYNVGAVDKESPGCFGVGLFTIVALIVVMGIVLTRFMMALTFDWFLSAKLSRPPKEQSASSPQNEGFHFSKRKAASSSSRNSIFPSEPNAQSPYLSHKGRSNSSPTISLASNPFIPTLPQTTASNSICGPMYGNTMSPKSNGPGRDSTFPTEYPTENDDMYTALLVTCYSEGETSLRTTLESLAATTYSDRRKLMIVIADGDVTGSGNDRSTPDILKDMIEPAFQGIPGLGETVPQSYVAVAQGSKQHNMAEVHAGHFVYRHHRVPTLLILKVGTPEEREKPKAGNRGKRDSQLILMNFFRTVTEYDSRMTPLDFDMFRKAHALMGIPPDVFEAVLMVDADTKVYPDSLTLLVNSLRNDPLIMGLCGETRIANKWQSWVTAIQVFEYHISHHLGKGFESVFGGVTCLPGCFCMYRLKARKTTKTLFGIGQQKNMDNKHSTLFHPSGLPNFGFMPPTKPDWIPILTKPEIINEYSQNVVTTLHQKNLLLLGEDRFLTTLMLRSFPRRKMMFVPQAVCKTVVPDEFMVLLSQRRRWINSTIHNLLELMLVRNLCGTFCFSMQFVIFLDLIGTIVLPVAMITTILLIIQIAKNTVVNLTSAMTLVLFVVGLGSPALLILITTRKVIYVFWMVVYLFALPIWNFVLPIYAFWHFDDFSWGETRKVEGEVKNGDHGTGEGEFGTGTVILRKWEHFELESRRIEKRNNLSCAQQYRQSDACSRVPSMVRSNSPVIGAGNFVRNSNLEIRPFRPIESIYSKVPTRSSSSMTHVRGAQASFNRESNNAKSQQRPTESIYRSPIRHHASLSNGPSNYGMDPNQVPQAYVGSRHYPFRYIPPNQFRSIRPASPYDDVPYIETNNPSSPIVRHSSKFSDDGIRASRGIPSPMSEYRRKRDEQNYIPRGQRSPVLFASKEQTPRIIHPISNAPLRSSFTI